MKLLYRQPNQFFKIKTLGGFNFGVDGVIGMKTVKNIISSYGL